MDYVTLVGKNVSDWEMEYMSRKLASIQKVLAVDSIPGADAIECLTILGWKVVAKKGEFKVNDLVCYCEVDSILPERPEFEFLRKNHFRIKTIKLKGQVSQGICFPLPIIPSCPLMSSIDEALQKYGIMKVTWQEGDDVTELLGVTKYEVQIPAQLAGVVKGNFPEFLHKTDEERIQTCPQLLEKHQNKKFYVTEKVDGSSMTVYLNNGEFGVCSRNMDLKETEGNSYWKVARELKLEEKLKLLGRNICLQGELIGQGVQGNKYKLSGLEFRVFNVFDIDSGKNEDYSYFAEVVSRLQLTPVPVITANYELPKTVDELVEYSKGKSLLNKDTPREGIVLRPLVEEYEPDLHGRLSFKCINPDFLLKYSDD
jgi:RNA ligase (TIGR02306 family)